MTSFAIRNFGCRVNLAEAFEWAARLEERGFRPAAEADLDGLVIVNTCTLTARADRDALQFIRRVARDHPQARIVVTGCLAERAPAEIAGLPGVWKVLRNGEKERLPEDLARDLDVPEPGPGFKPSRFRARAFLKVQDGCDRACSFCIIPTVRGRSRSVPPARILAGVLDLAARGYREIVLTGIHLSSYGRDLDPRSSPGSLLGAIESLPGDFWVRLSSLDPRLVAGDFLERLSTANRLRPHFHLSLQSGSESILKAMGRPGLPADAEVLMTRLARRAPDAAIGADFIVGFPGETAEDFRLTLELFERSPLAYAHVFSYSPRPGTPASKLPAVEGRTIRQRAVRLRARSLVKNREFRRRFLGRVLEGIAIGPKADGWEILTGNAIDVRTPQGSARKGDAVRVRITGISDTGTSGEIVR